MHATMTSRSGVGLALLIATAYAAPAGVLPPVPRLPAGAPDTPDAEAEPALPPEPADPAALAERIAQNTKLAGDRLRDSDPGDQTRKTQQQILKDIDELLKQAQNPPPQGGGGGGGSGEPNAGDQSQSGQSGGESGGSNSAGGGDSSRQQQAGQGGASSQRPGGGGGWRERRQGAAAQRQPGGSGGQPQPGHRPAGIAGANPGPDGSSGGRADPALPFDDPITKQVWGHLPERLRQQMTQYYREQYMSKYGELLRDYYSSLAERDKSGNKR